MGKFGVVCLPPQTSQIARYEYRRTTAEQMPTTHSSTPVAAVRLHDQMQGTNLQAGQARLWRAGKGCDITMKTAGQGLYGPEPA